MARCLMTDFLTKEKRSKVMSAIRAKGNKTTELALMGIFRKNKITGWRRNKKLSGSPDFVFLKQRLAVFVDGCFWHGHKCLKPRDSLKTGFWKDKIERNKERDNSVNQALKKNGWKVVRVWECEIEKKKYSKKLKVIKNHLDTANSNL
jgi:DNA mismatch endonuclease, patch repair protein